MDLNDPKEFDDPKVFDDPKGISSMGFDRVAELGSLSSGAKMAMNIFVKRMFTIFATNTSFLRVITNLQI